MRIFIVLMLMLIFSGSVFAMDKDSYNSDRKLSTYSVIIINDFDTNNIVIKNLDNDEMSKFKPQLLQIKKDITEGLIKEIKNKTKFQEILTNNSAVKKNAVRLEAKIDEFNGGHGAAKWALGPFAPKSVKTYLSYSGSLIDVESGNVLGTFSDTNNGSLWFKDSLSYSKEMMEDIASSVSDFIEDNY